MNPRVRTLGSGSLGVVGGALLAVAALPVGASPVISRVGVATRFSCYTRDAAGETDR